MLVAVQVNCHSLYLTGYKAGPDPSWKTRRRKYRLYAGATGFGECLGWTYIEIWWVSCALWGLEDDWVGKRVSWIGRSWGSVWFGHTKEMSLLRLPYEGENCWNTKLARCGWKGRIVRGGRGIDQNQGRGHCIRRITRSMLLAWDWSQIPGSRR